MDLLLARDLVILLEDRPGPCVSLYMPTIRSGPEIRQGAIRLKNLLGEVRERLEERGLSVPDAEALLAPAERLLDDPLFWQRQGDGLALFCAPGFFRSFRLPCGFTERILVADYFFLRPLLPLVESDGPFYILALSQNEVRLLEATRQTVRRLDSKILPHSLVEALGAQTTTHILQYHTASPAGRGAQGAVYHGRGTGDEDVKAELRRYLQRVDAAVCELLAGRTAPLVLAGAEPLPPIYREVNGYPHLLGEAVVHGNPEPLRDEELRDRAWKLVAPHFEEGRVKAEEHWQELAGTRRTSNEVAEILPAAVQGRVEVLFVDGGSDVWGRFDRGAGEVQIHPAPESEDQELLEAATLFSLRNGGTVYAVDHGRVPGGRELAALFRY
jgi:hypothetical protein